MDSYSLSLGADALNDGCGGAPPKRQRAIRPRRIGDIEVELSSVLGYRPSQEQLDRVVDLVHGKGGKDAIKDAIKEAIRRHLLDA